MDAASSSAWFDDYLQRFAAAGRGERDARSVLDSYAIPLLLTNDDQFAPLTNAEQILATIESLLAVMQAEDYARTDLLSSEVSVLNRKAALLEASFVRLRRDESEIAKHTATYLLTESEGEIRISALCMHGT